MGWALGAKVTVWAGPWGPRSRCGPGPGGQGHGVGQVLGAKVTVCDWALETAVTQRNLSETMAGGEEQNK